jgi:hypothetical protein
MFVRTKVFPKPGCYHAEIEVHGGARAPDLLNGTLLDDGNSAERCF